VKKKSANADGRDGLEEAMRQLTLAQATLTQVQATSTQTQATLAQTQAAFVADMSEMKRESAQRFARIEADIATILRVLAEHGRMLQALPEAVRDKIGFKPQS